MINFSDFTTKKIRFDSCNKNIAGDAATKIVHIPFIFLATVFITGFVAAINGPNVRSVLQVLVLLFPIFFE